MKKLLAIAAMSAAASLGTGSAQAGTWEVLCVKQGPARCFSHLPKRVLSPTLNTNPGNAAGYPIGARSIPAKMKNPEKSDVVGEMNFFSLGFGGEVILKYNNPSSQDFFANVPAGSDLTVFETTWGNPTCRPLDSEKAKLEVSENGVNWIATNVCYNGDIDMGPLLKAKYVRITDITPSGCNLRGDGVDAYDVDGVESKADWNPSTTNPLCDYRQGVTRQFAGMGMPSGTGIVPQRKNFANANINDPSFTAAEFMNPALREISGVYNFWSIGFGGYACFQLPFTVWDNPSQPDIRLFETTWNNKPCTDGTNDAAGVYPEKVVVFTSPDGVNWSAGKRLCKDGTHDITGEFAAINYVKLVDASDPTRFGAGDDSYDIDNIYVEPISPNTPAICGEEQPNTPPVPPGSSWEYCLDCQCSDSWKTTMGGWSTGSAPFGNVSGAGVDGITDFNYNTLWPADDPNDGYDLRVRKKINLSGYDLNNITWNLGVAGGYVLYVNGHVVSVSIGLGYTYRWEFSGTIPPAYLLPGDNIIAIAMMNNGPNTAFDFNMEAGPAASVRTTTKLGEVSAAYSEGGVPEQMFALSMVGGNVVSDKIAFQATIAEEGGYKYAIRNHTGQEVAGGAFEGNLYDTPTAEVATGKFAPGVYFLTLSSATGKETIKFIKK